MIGWSKRPLAAASLVIISLIRLVRFIRYLVPIALPKTKVGDLLFCQQIEQFFRHHRHQRSKLRLDVALLQCHPCAVALQDADRVALRGGEANTPLARAVIGGLTASTALTLFVVPCLYAIVKRGGAAAAPAARGEGA